LKAIFSTAGYRYCCFCFLLLALVCGSISLGQAQNYYPDEVGNTWILRSKDGIEERLVTIEGPETIRNESLKVISDGTYPVSDPASNDPNKFFIKATPNEVQIFRATATIQGFDATIDYSPPETFLPVPIELGTEWTVVGDAKVVLFGGVEIKIPTTNVAQVVVIEDVTVPAGTFRDCLKIEQQLSTSGLVTSSQQSAMWLAPDFGLVKSLNSNGVRFELIDYDVTIGGPVVAVEPKEKLATTWGALKKR
jgi:hypothetical protein